MANFFKKEREIAQRIFLEGSKEWQNKNVERREFDTMVTDVHNNFDIYSNKNCPIPSIE